MAKPFFNDNVEVFTDGACHGNPGPCGWGYCVTNNGTEIHSAYKYLGEATNNIAELEAFRKALEYILEKNYTKVVLHTDSQYVCKGYNEWLAGWVRKGWKNSQGKPVANSWSWKKIRKMQRKFHARTGCRLTVKWVKAHAGNKFNEQADRLATMAIEEHYLGEK